MSVRFHECSAAWELCIGEGLSPSLEFILLHALPQMRGK